ncbi:AhpC/TSA family protein [Chryseobacterium sp. PCH239]|uniref:TlpA disulfide reductase family protein n=1 Tax=Chryseobacterium sp. PCH239 TaxID=2825845 RepID=UPI001C10D066|nr:TlpA disulfide reductase family protein [Chryseobacterium sp. PCH239]QWT84559.1 AhpC/TSA family protein [Chryseobacterium sp. PCH239]
MNKGITFLCLCCIALFFLSCSKKDSIRIIGDLPNLPDGTIYLFQDTEDHIIDSAQTKKGKFEISHLFDENQLGYLGVYHKDQKKITRYFSYLTYIKYRGSGSYVSRFIKDSLIIMSGEIKYYDLPKGFVVNENIKLTDMPLKKVGRQTKAFYSTSLDLFNKIDPDKIKKQIKKYPYSYYLLNKLNENRNRCTPAQLEEFLLLFDDEVKRTEPYEELLNYNDKRGKNRKKLSIPLLENPQAHKADILDMKYNKHLIVFWASWCGPCRKEIPLLKKVYQTKDKDTEFISISIDADKTLWKEALEKEQMPWKQFVVKKGEMAYDDLEILLRFNSAVPYTVLIDNDLKVLKSSTGLSSETELMELARQGKVK